MVGWVVNRNIDPAFHNGSELTNQAIQGIEYLSFTGQKNNGRYLVSKTRLPQTSGQGYP
jgi:hypothetical protein